MNRKIRIAWPDLQMEAVATLAEDKNPMLCEEFWNALPMESIMNNAVVTDGSMYCWVPMLCHADIQFKERIDLAPIGRLRYSQNTGNKFIIQYGQCNENIYGAVLGMVDSDYIDIIRRVGMEAMKAIFLTKQELHVAITRIGDDGATSDLIHLPEQCEEEVREIADELVSLGLKASREEPEELKRIRTGKNSGMGSCGQYFSTWEFSYSLLRDFSMYTLYPIARLCRNEAFNIRQLEIIFNEIGPTYVNLLGSYGLKKFYSLIKKVRTMINNQRLTKEEFTVLIDAMCFYTNMLSQWSYFYYPWGIGCSCFRFDDDHKVYIPDTI